MDKTPIYSQYKKFKEQYPNHIVLMRIGDFYEAFGEDALTLTDVEGLWPLALRKVKISKDFEIEMVGVPYFVVDKYLDYLISSGKKAILVETK